MPSVSSGQSEDTAGELPQPRSADRQRRESVCSLTTHRRGRGTAQAWNPSARGCLTLGALQSPGLGLLTWEVGRLQDSGRTSVFRAAGSGTWPATSDEPCHCVGCQAGRARVNLPTSRLHGGHGDALFHSQRQQTGGAGLSAAGWPAAHVSLPEGARAARTRTALPPRPARGSENHPPKPGSRAPSFCPSGLAARCTQTETVSVPCSRNLGARGHLEGGGW